MTKNKITVDQEKKYNNIMMTKGRHNNVTDNQKQKTQQSYSWPRIKRQDYGWPKQRIQKQCYKWPKAKDSVMLQMTRSKRHNDFTVDLKQKTTLNYWWPQQTFKVYINSTTTHAVTKWKFTGWSEHMLTRVRPDSLHFPRVNTVTGLAVHWLCGNGWFYYSCR